MREAICAAARVVGDAARDLEAELAQQALAEAFGDAEAVARRAAAAMTRTGAPTSTNTESIAVHSTALPAPVMCGSRRISSTAAEASR